MEKVKTGLELTKQDLLKIKKEKGYVDLPILLSKLYTNNSSKELIHNIKQLINNLYDNKQITRQVYNILNKAINYGQSTNVYDIYKNDSK